MASAAATPKLSDKDGSTNTCAAARAPAFSLHFRESAVLRMVAEADLGGAFHSKQKYGAKIGRQSWEALGLKVPSEV